MPAAALVRCVDEIGRTQITGVRMIRYVAYVIKVPVGDGEGLLAVLDRDMRTDDFEESVLPALQSLRFVAQVEPVEGGHGGLSERMAHRTALLDFADSLLPSPPQAADAKALSDYAGRLREWVRTRDILVDETCPRIRG